jgi:hypothetical protein
MPKETLAEPRSDKKPTNRVCSKVTARFISLSVILPALLTSAMGCAIHYYDAKNGAEHLWGFGHIKMKVIPANEGVQAVVKGTETLGFNLAAGTEDYHVGLGWDYRRRILISSNAAIRLEWPDADFFNVRVGNNPPFTTNFPTYQKAP